MYKKFAINILLLLFLNILIKPLWIFGFDRTIQNEVGTATYGAYFTVLNFTMLFSILLDIGINNYNNRVIAQQPLLLPKFFPSILLVKLVLAVIYGLVGYIGMRFLSYEDYQYTWCWLLMFNQVLISFIQYFRSNLTALHFFKTDSVISILDRCLMMFLCGILLFTPFSNMLLSIKWFIYVQTIAYLITALISACLVFKQISKFTLSFDWQFIKKLLINCYPYALIGLLMGAYTRLDAVLFSYWLPSAEAHYEAGVYAASYRLLDAANMVGLQFATILLPMFANMLANGKNIEGLVTISVKAIAIIIIPVVIAAFTYKQPIISTLYFNSENYFSSVFGILILSFVPVSFMYIYSTILTANGNLKHLNKIAFAAVLLNVFLNYWFINRWGALGAACAALITQSFASIAYTLTAIKIVNLQHTINTLKQVMVYFAICYLIIFVFKNMHFIWWLNLIISLIACWIGAFAMLLFINKENFFEKIKSFKN